MESGRLLLIITFLHYILVYTSLSGIAQTSKDDSLRGSLNKWRNAYDVTYYHLYLDTDFKKYTFKCSTYIEADILTTTQRIQIDLFKNWIVDSIISDNQCQSWQRQGNAVFINLKKKQEAGNKLKLSFYYHGFPVVAQNPPWDGGIVLSKDSLHRPWVGIANEGVGASLWWPNKDHLSEEPDSIRLTCKVESGLTCVSNGRLEIAENNSSFNTFTWNTSYPINNYNVTFNIANYAYWNDTLKLPSGKILGLHYYVLDYNLEKSKYHFQQVKTILKIFSELFGDYPFLKDGYKLVETSYLGMEHQSAISYGNKFENDILDYDFIILHETAHEWWGNSVSIRDHAELWIHEAFATYSETLFLEKVYGQKTSLTYLLKQRQLIKNQNPLLGPLDVNYKDWKDSDIYYKGSWMLHTIRNLIANDTIWFGLLKGISKDFKLTSIDTPTLIKYINRKVNIDFTQIINYYLKSNSPPHLEYYFKNSNDITQLFLRWANNGFALNMELEVKYDSKILRIPVTNQWQEIPLNIKNMGSFEVLTDKFYITESRIR